MRTEGQAHLLRIFVNESDRYEGRAVYETIIRAARDQGLAGATAWRGVEHGGIDPVAMKGSPTGVFVGVMHHDYVDSTTSGSRRLRPDRLHPRAGGPGDHRRHRLLVVAGGAAPGRAGAARRASARWPWPAASP